MTTLLREFNKKSDDLFRKTNKCADQEPTPSHEQVMRQIVQHQRTCKACVTMNSVSGRAIHEQVVQVEQLSCLYSGVWLKAPSLCMRSANCGSVHATDIHSPLHPQLNESNETEILLSSLTFLEQYVRKLTELSGPK